MTHHMGITINDRVHPSCVEKYERARNETNNNYYCYYLDYFDSKYDESICSFDTYYRKHYACNFIPDWQGICNNEPRWSLFIR